METSNGHWKTIIIENEKFFISCFERKDETCFKISLTNLRDIWIESLDKNKIIQKCKVLNPSLCIEEIDVVQFVGQLLENIESYAVKKSVESIRLAKDLDGGIFRFSIDFEKGNSQQLWEEVTMPLCLVAGELCRRQTILLDLVRKKDEEITEYKLNGAELIRKHIETARFDQKVFERNAPQLNTEGALEAFKNVMETQANGEMCIKLESICQMKGSNDSENSRKIEEIIESGAKDVGLVENNAVRDNSEPIENEDTESPSIILPKVATADVTMKKIKKSKSDDYEENEAITRKKARSAPLLSFKRTNNTIHDFIK